MNDDEGLNKRLQKNSREKYHVGSVVTPLNRPEHGMVPDPSASFVRLLRVSEQPQTTRSGGCKSGPT